MKSKGNVLILNENKHITSSTSNVDTTTAASLLIDQKCGSNTTSETTLDDILFQLVMFIIESRKQDTSSLRGCKEGIHANLKKTNHLCSPKNNECHIAYQVKNKLSKCVLENSNANKNIYSASLITNSGSTTVNTQSIKSSQIISTINTTKRTQSLSPSPSRSSSSSSSSTTIGSSSRSVCSPINIIIDVCLLADCCYDTIKTDLIESKSFISYELLERWNISIMPNKKSENNKLTINELFQAIRSYLHFSQISSWLNQNKGQLPKTIAYSIFSTQDTNRILNNTNESSNQSLALSLQQSSTTTTPYINEYFDDKNNNNHNNKNTDDKFDEVDEGDNNSNDQELNLKKNFDFQTFPSITIICGTNQLYNLTINLQAKKRKNSLTPPFIFCNNLNKCLKYNQNNINIDKEILHQYFETINNDSNHEKLNYDLSKMPKDNFIQYSTQTESKVENKILKTPIFPSTGERRRLSSDTLESDTKLPNSKCLKCYNTSPHDKLSGVFSNNNNNNNNNTDDDSGISSFNIDNKNNDTSINNSNNSLNLTPKLSLSNRNLKISNLLENNLLTPPSSFDNTSLISYSPSSPLIVLSNLEDVFSKEFNLNHNENSKVLTELCVSTKNQLNLIDNNEKNNNNSDYSNNINNNSQSLLTSTPLTCNIKSNDNNNNNNNIAKTIDNNNKTFFYLNNYEDDEFNSNDNKTELINDDQQINDDKQLQLKFKDQNQDLIHYIRSPTDGVCLPIFNNNNSNNLNMDLNYETNKDVNIIKRNQRSANVFHNKSGLPLSSSPAPMRKSGSAFNFDKSLKNPKSIKNALSLNLLKANVNDEVEDQSNKPIYYNFRTFNQISSSCRLLGTFEESLLNGRINPMGTVDGFYAQIGASGSFFPEHVTLPVHAAFYQVCEDIAASPYLGLINLSAVGRRGYKVPNKGTIQVTLFNPNNTVVKMFVVMYDLSDMPPNHRTFLRQRTMYVPLPSMDCADENNNNFNDDLNKNTELKSYLRYSIHLRFATSKSGKLYLHTNIKLIFARNKCEIDPRLAKYEYKTFTDAPKAPKYSSRK